MSHLRSHIAQRVGYRALVPHPLTIYAASDRPIDEAEIHALCPDATIVVDGPSLRVRFDGLEIAINGMASEKLAAHLSGFIAYVRAQCVSSGERVEARIAATERVYGCVVSPALDQGERALHLVVALAEARDGILFIEGGVYAPDGTCLAAPEEDGSDDDEDDDEAGAPPDARRVARRAAVLCAVTARAFSEEGRNDVASTIYREFVSRNGLEGELEDDERTLLDAPPQQAPAVLVVDATWRIEGLLVLAWALSRIDPTPPDVQIDPVAVYRALDFDHQSAATPLQAPVLRPREELDRMRRRLLAVHWRLREQALRPGPIDFVKFSRDAWFGGFELEGIPIVDGDLALGGVPLSQASIESIRAAQGIAQERHRAINWLLGENPIYGEVDTPT